MHGELDLETMMEHLFRKSKGQSYCKTCQQNVKGQSQRKILVLPKSIIIVLDRFDDAGALKNLLGSFPQELDFKKYMIDSNTSTFTRYQLSGFITQDPILHDYSVCLRNKKKEIANLDHDWVTFNKRGL